MGTEIKIKNCLPILLTASLLPRDSEMYVVPPWKGLSSFAKHILPPLIVPGVQRGLQLSAVQSLGRSPRSGSARQFFVAFFVNKSKGDFGLCVQHGLYRAGQGKLLLTKSIVGNGTAADNTITPGTRAWRMLSLLTVIAISALFSNL